MNASRSLDHISRVLKGWLGEIHAAVLMLIVDAKSATYL